MAPERKIDFRKYLPLSILPYVGEVIFERTIDVLIACLVIYVSVVISQMMLVSGANKMLGATQGTNRLPIVAMFIGKAIVLFLGIAIGVHFIGNKVIIPVIFYIYQIFILVVSLKRN